MGNYTAFLWGFLSDVTPCLRPRPQRHAFKSNSRREASRHSPGRRRSRAVKREALRRSSRPSAPCSACRWSSCCPSAPSRFPPARWSVPTVMEPCPEDALLKKTCMKLQDFYRRTHSSGTPSLGFLQWIGNDYSRTLWCFFLLFVTPCGFSFKIRIRFGSQTRGRHRGRFFYTNSSGVCLYSALSYAEVVQRALQW